jgi:hypothetical protein
MRPLVAVVVLVEVAATMAPAALGLKQEAAVAAGSSAMAVTPVPITVVAAAANKGMAAPVGYPGVAEVEEGEPPAMEEMHQAIPAEPVAAGRLPKVEMAATYLSLAIPPKRPWVAVGEAVQVGQEASAPIREVAAAAVIWSGEGRRPPAAAVAEAAEVFRAAPLRVVPEVPEGSLAGAEAVVRTSLA